MAPSIFLAKSYPPDRLYEIGKKAYTGQKYEHARDAFNMAIEAIDGCSSRQDQSVLIALLDMRAATFMKLKEMSAALDDGRRLLKHDNKSVKGHLRVAKILIEMEKPDKALQIYQRGIDRCDRSHPRYSDLHARLDHLAFAAKAIDPMSLLPMEVLDSIFQYLSLKTLCACTKVSKSWKYTLTSHASLWKTIDLSPTRAPIRTQDFDAMIRYSQGSLNELIVKGVAIQARRLLELIFVRNKRLQKLTLLSGGLLQKNFLKALRVAKNLRILHLGGKVSLCPQTAGDVLKACPVLTDYKLDGVIQTNHEEITSTSTGNLQSLSIDMERHADRSRPDLIFRGESALRTLRLVVTDRDAHFTLMPLIRQASQLEHLETHGNLHTSSESPLTDLPENLRSLTMTNAGLTDVAEQSWDTSDVDALWEWQRKNNASRVPNLSDLCIRETNAKVGARLVQELLFSGKSANEANYCRLAVGCGNWDSEDLEAVVSSVRLQDVQHLELDACLAFDDRAAAMVAQRFKRLKELVLRQATLTGVGVKALVQGLPKLYHLDLSGCWTVGRDAVDWAERQGLKVDYKLM